MLIACGTHQVNISCAQCLETCVEGLGHAVLMVPPFSMNVFSAQTLGKRRKIHVGIPKTHGSLVVTKISSRGMPEALIASPTAFSVPVEFVVGPGFSW